MPNATTRHRSASLAPGLCAVCAMALLSCGIFSDRSDLNNSKRMANCRLDANRACREDAKLDESLDVEECVSERSWSCALSDGEEPTGSGDGHKRNP